MSNFDRKEVANFIDFTPSVGSSTGTLGLPALYWVKVNEDLLVGLKSRRTV